MVIYDLHCENSHEFEGWFKNADELKSQQSSGMLTCPVCNTSEISKKVTASKIGRKSNVPSASATAPQAVASGAPAGSGERSYEQLQSMLGQVHKYIDGNFTDVGNKFADEALKIHRGEKDAANIRGTASKSELKELAQEGVSALPIPPKPVDKGKLN